MTTSETVYATTDEGLRLPVVDVTTPAFKVTVTDAELDVLTAQFVLESASRPEMSPAVRQALAQSILGKALMAAVDTFLPGLDTYFLKIGPDHLRDPFTEIDRRIAASFPGFTTRIRLQDMASLIADGLKPILAADTGRPICLVNVAGGPAADSWNALIHLRREAPGLLGRRAIAIAVLDLDDRGPQFGKRAIAALAASDGPLSGLAIDVRHVPYDWSQSDRLGSCLDDLRARESACAISSEGGLFEYGTDEVVAANLAQLHAGTPADAFVVGSVTRDNEATRASKAAARVPTQPRTLEAFRKLALGTGWSTERALERPFTYNVRLVKAR